MKNRWITVFCFLLVLISCKKAEGPGISQKKMVDILVDVHLVEASLLGYSEEMKDSLSQLYYGQIYEIHSISKDSFLIEMDYLKHYPDYLGKIYEKVLEEIDKREAELK